MPDNLQSIGGNAPSELTLYTNTYSNVVGSFASVQHLTYIYDDKTAYPCYQLICVAPANAIGTRGMRTGDGTIRVTRGTEGEETLLPEDYAILSEDSVIFMDEVVPESPAYKQGYTFYGWYTDPEFKTPWRMNRMPGANLTLYARIEPLLHIRYAVNLSSAGITDGNLAEGSHLFRPIGELGV